jgi:hypothetical protein
MMPHPIPIREPIPEPPFHIVQTWHDFVWECWQRRACFVCGGYGWCRHREVEAESVQMFEATMEMEERER